MPGSSNIVILNYHRIRRDGEPAKRSSADFYCISQQQFEAHLRFLKEQRFRTLLIDEFVDKRDIADKREVILTFDDGCLSDYEIALPLLKEFGFRAVFFICIEYVGRPGYMSWKQIAKLLEMQMSVQSHGLLHRDLTQLSDGDIVDEVKAARICLERNLGVDIKFLSLPGGFSDPHVYSAAFRAGYKAICNSDPGIATRGPVLNRIALQHSTSQMEFEDLVEGGHRAIAITRLKYKTARQIKRLIGVQRYEMLKVKFWGAAPSSVSSFEQMAEQREETRTKAGGA